MHQIYVHVYILVKMAELSTVEMIEIVNGSPKFSDSTPRNEVELEERQSVSTCLAPNIAETHQDEINNDEGGIIAVKNENLSFDEVNNSSDNHSEVESTIPKGKGFDLFLFQKVSRHFCQIL